MKAEEKLSTESNFSHLSTPEKLPVKMSPSDTVYVIKNKLQEVTGIGIQYSKRNISSSSSASILLK